MILEERLLGEDLLLLGLPLVSEFLLCAGATSGGALSLRLWIGLLENCLWKLLSLLGERSLLRERSLLGERFLLEERSLLGKRSPLGERSDLGERSLLRERFLLGEDLLCCKILVPLLSMLLLGLTEVSLLLSEPLELKWPSPDLALVGDKLLPVAFLLSLVV